MQLVMLPENQKPQITPWRLQRGGKPFRWHFHKHKHLAKNLHYVNNSTFFFAVERRPCNSLWMSYSYYRNHHTLERVHYYRGFIILRLELLSGPCSYRRSIHSQDLLWYNTVSLRRTCDYHKQGCWCFPVSQVTQSLQVGCVKKTPLLQHSKVE